MRPKSKYKLTIEAGHIVAPSAEHGIFGSVGNKPAKLHINHDGSIAGWDRDSALNAERQIGNQNCIVGPGFIDIHFHGYGDQSGEEYSEIGSFQNPEKILEKVPAYGTTGCLATLLVPAQTRRFFGVDLDARFKMLRTQLAEMSMKDTTGPAKAARLIGMHLEGPKINPKVRGAISRSSIWDATIRDLPGIIGENESGPDGHNVCMMTVAPEMDFSFNFALTHALRERGIVVALGHSEASMEQTIAAIKAGARHMTHFFNAMASLNHRNPGIVGAGLVDPRIYDAQELGLSLEVVCDFFHISPAVLSLALERHHIVAAVSDSVAHPGMSDGTYEFGGQRVTIAEGAVRLVQDGRLAGSVMTMLQTFRNLLLLEGDNPDIVRAFEMTSTNPARILGLTDTGSVEKRLRADLTIFDKDYNLLYTIVNGDIAYENPLAASRSQRPSVTVQSQEGVRKPTAEEAVLGLRISAYSIWSGYTTNEEEVNIVVEDLNGNPRHKQGFTGREAILDSAAWAISQACKAAVDRGLTVTALGIALSGLVDSPMAVMAMNLPGWKDFDIRRELIKRLRNMNDSFLENIPIRVENSASAIALAIARTKKLRALADIKRHENFVFVKIGRGLGTGVIVDNRTISCMEDIAADHYIHLRDAITNVHNGLPTLLHQTVLMNRLVAKGELALMRTCDDTFPELHLEALVSMGGIVHYARDEEKREGRIFFRRQKIQEIINALQDDPYAYEHTSFELDLSVNDVLDVLKQDGEDADHARSVFHRMGMALGSGIFSLANTLDAPIRHVIVQPQMGTDFTDAIEIVRQGVMTSLTRGSAEAGEWQVTFITPESDLNVLAGASLCYL